MANVRIIEQPEITTLSGGEFLVTDSQAAGTKKITPQNLVEAAGGGSGSGVSDDLKTALLQLASKVAYIDDDGQDYYDDLYDALYPPSELLSISAVYTQSGTVYDTDTLNDLKADLVVTAHYTNNSTITVPSTDYTLSGTLTAGTSTITVSYQGKTTTFNVTVSEGTYLAKWDLTQSLVDEVNGNTIVLTQENENGTLTQTSDGIVFTGYSSYGTANTHDDAAHARSDTETKYPRSTLTKIDFGDLTPNFYTNGGSQGATYQLANGLLVEAPLQLFWRGVSDKFSGWFGGGWKDDYYTAVTPDYFANKRVEMAVNFLGGGTIKCGDTTVAEIPGGSISADGFNVGFGRNGGQAYHDAKIKKITIENLPTERDTASIMARPLTFHLSASVGSWNPQTQTLSVTATGGTSSWNNGVLNNLVFTYSDVDDAVFRFSATVTITGVENGTTGSGASVATGLYTSANPQNSGAARKANKTIWSKLENGTFDVSYEAPISEMFTGENLDSYYLGISFFVNASTQITGTLSNISAEVAPNVSV